MENVLWPLLFEFLVPLQYTDAVAAIARSLAYLGEKKRAAQKDPHYMIDYDKRVNVPKPVLIIARVIVR